ncbi:MAG TPA: polysaccharide lyase family protein [Terriglobales bacterium]|nr:polysaccharide lyase family protein [Terriglobales bacterium]
MKRTCCFVISYAVLVLFFIVSAVAQDRGTVIWRIGEFNSSSGEFRSQDIDYTNPNSDITFEVGKSKTADWIRFQPGPANGMTGGRLHPFTIRFNLPSTPRGIFRLKLAVLYETPRLSFLKFAVNGHSGLFYFHPKLDFHAGDWEGTFVPQTSIDTKIIDISPEWLKQGENAFVLTAMDDPNTRQDTLGAIAPGHTGIIYDALELTNDRNGRYDPKAFSARIEPTIFYQQTKVLREIVEIFPSFASFPKQGMIELAIGDGRFSQLLRGQDDFGERRFEFPVPEWTGKITATVTVKAAGVQTAQSEVEPAKKWNLVIIPHEHLDVGFTDYAAKVAELHSQSIDDVMKVQQKIPDFRWTLDGSWVANQYIAGRSSAAQEQFFNAVRKGDIVIPPEFANQHTGNASLEGLFRAFSDSHRLALKHNLPRPEAAQTVDVPSYTWALPSVLNQVGIKYFLGASNSWRAPVVLLGRWNEKSPFYWEGPDGSRVLMWYSRAYLQMHTLFGSPWRMESVRDALPVFLQAYTRPDYVSSTAIIFGSQLENTPFTPEQAEIVGTWNAQYAFPHLQFGTVQTAMQQIEREADGKFPVFRGDLGPYWEDGYGSDSAYTAIHRENQERILTAEKLSVLPMIFAPRLRPDLSLLNQAWTNELTYDEHTWTYVGATSQPEHQQSEDQINLKRARVTEAKREIDESVQRSFAQLTGLLSPEQGSIAVFNSLTWKRNGLVEYDLPDGFEIFDSSSKATIPYEVVFVGKGIKLPGFGSGYKRVRFEAKQLPALGYRLYPLRLQHTAPSESGSQTSNEVENQFYRIKLDGASGAIASIFDKQLGKELVDQKSSYKFGSYLYVTGGDDYPNNSLYRFVAGLNPPNLTVHPAENGRIVSVKKTPYGSVVTTESSGVNTPRIHTEITLFDSEKKIELRYHLHKDRVLTRESAYIAFPFLIDRPSFEYSNQIGWVNPAKDELPGGSREWYVARHWAAVHNQDTAATVVPVDAPLVTFGDIMRGKWLTHFQPASSTIFSWLMNNYWGTNFPAWQGGDYTFRYVITSGAKFEPTALNQFGLEAMTPLETTQVPQAKVPAVIPSTETSFLSIDNHNVELSTWKVAEDGHGTILRLQETSGTPQDVHLHSDYFKFVHAWNTTALEDNISESPTQNGDIVLSLRPFQSATIRVETSATTAGGN